MRIRHVPLGSGHPYTDDTEQRSPTLPVAGEPLRLGARATTDATTVVLHLTVTRVDGAREDLEVPCSRVSRSSRGQVVDGGHLASAQARQQRGAGGWEAELDVPDDAASITYRFSASGDAGSARTREFRSEVAAWRTADDSLVDVTGAAVAVVPGSVRALCTPTRIARVSFALPLARGEHVAGFGERFDAIDQRGAALDSQLFEQYKSQGAMRRTYMPMPFAHVVGGSGWGFHVETSRRVWFDVGAADSDLMAVEAVVDAPVEALTALSVRTFTGTPAEVLDAFLSRVGRSRELPGWVFGLWASGNEWNTQAEVERQVALHREHGIPIGSVVIEAWSDESTFTAWRDAEYTPRADGGPLSLADFTFPEDGAWPDPKGMVDSLHDEDVRLLLWQIPLIKMRPHPTAQAAADAAAAVRDGRVIQEPAPDGSLRPYRNRGWWFPLSLMPDLTDDAAARWWTDKRRYLVDEIGIDGFKTDGGEHAWGDELVYLDGGRGDERNNEFPVAYAKAYGDLLERAGKAPVTFSRAGFTGSQAHGAFWAGDENSTWDAFRWSMWAGLNAATCGIVYWGWDIAGFSGPVPDAELYVRAFAASAFVPIMQYHSEFNHHRTPSRDRTPWNIAEQSGDAAVIAEIREIVALRERLRPYLEAQARLSIETSRPLMRPLFFDHPHDPAVWEASPQWTLGDDILVAPVLAPGEDWNVYLPDGEWRDAWTGEAQRGGATVRTTTPRHRVPVFVRERAWSSLRPVFHP
ncbi:TIM-barrel domain-containing protein [Demequina sp. NBRC 110052]|uniref:glycoside hydrolase family 31 protein n=1 Tax=Demequina sp. NBRC 110052 TaxID=1570341 RepID=UPI000A05939C|nr:TIM-barrel domain-containing protein [Demequina sp. NBRC 110052]